MVDGQGAVAAAVVGDMFACAGTCFDFNNIMMINQVPVFCNVGVKFTVVMFPPWHLYL